jgi:Arc/MetJ-type ribon-helix-helix transcriptional regulator
MAKENIICFRIDAIVRERIARCIGGHRYQDRTALIRTAIERLLDDEDRSRSRWTISQ